MKRSESRVNIMVILYQIFMFQTNNIEYDVNEIINNITTNSNSFIDEIVNGVLNNKEEIFKIANDYLKDWNVTRLGYPDQAVLSMGIYEVLHTDTPGKVVIDESIELAKKYSDDKVKNMINGVLDKVYNNKK